MSTDCQDMLVIYVICRIPEVVSQSTRFATVDQPRMCSNRLQGAGGIAWIARVEYGSVAGWGFANPC